VLTLEVAVFCSRQISEPATGKIQVQKNQRKSKCAHTSFFHMPTALLNRKLFILLGSFVVISLNELWPVTVRLTVGSF